MVRYFLILTVSVAGIVASAAAASADDPLTEMRACRALPDAARLACFDAAMARRDGTVAVAQPAPQPVAQPVPPPAAPAAAPSDFGSDRLPPSGDAPPPVESLTAKVAAVSLNAFEHFTVTLDNGQVWRQLDSDTATARFKPAATVKITKGFLASYSLAVDGVWGTYKVKRIK